MSLDLPVAERAYGAADFARDAGATAAQLRDVETFRVLLKGWNSRMNLVGPSALPAFWQRHAWDSAQLLHVEQAARVWADIGSGAGFPGVVLAILLKGREGAAVHLIESVAKRVRFLEAAATELALPVVIHHARAEEVAPPASLDVVTARACAPLGRLFGYARQLFRPGVKGLFLKGREVEAELADARREWTFRSERIASRSDPSGVVLRIQGLARRDG